MNLGVYRVLYKQRKWSEYFFFLLNDGMQGILNWIYINFNEKIT